MHFSETISTEHNIIEVQACCLIKLYFHDYENKIKVIFHFVLCYKSSTPFTCKAQ